MSFYSEIVDEILKKEIKSKESIHKAKIRFCKKHGWENIPPDSKILANLPSDLSEEEVSFLKSVLRKKPMRTVSGVAVIAVMTSPEECPHGRCIPCPGGPEICTPQSYTGHEPAAMRAEYNDFDPFLQTKNRLGQLKAIGHPVDKIDFIIMGGTFTARLFSYQSWFVKRCLDALNGEKSKSLSEAKKINENASNRCIGLTVETRPDWFRLQQIDQSLKLGATRVELGVQTVDDSVLYNIQRGHTVKDSILATRNSKNAGLKVCYHWMPGLPGVDLEKDLEDFKTVFNNPEFKPDMLKIYPTLTVEGTELYKRWQKGEYKPLTTEKAIDLIAEIKTFVPEWVRIQRIQRDIPAQKIDAGVDKSNLRQLVRRKMSEEEKKCNCIRCREIGHQKQNFYVNERELKMETVSYEASGSQEIFIQLVDNKRRLYGFLRLRDIIDSHRFELQQKPCMVIRELKVLGRELSIGKKHSDAVQHRGFGKKLIKEAEKICREIYDKKYLFVLSGVGVKDYYRKRGFKDKGVYMVKKI
ncbi:MAG: tRNA uridine(34) 5-carboxymethylaminomethyl modification radical SAM/GNAT enzyme Elp3 [Candidatus Thermoplasmatota archaeon]